MLKRKNRKGFTLAELLIVVAIIAVLVAIAVPLFVGSLNKAKEARDNANIRAVRGAAVVYLLENSTDSKLWPETVNGWTVDALISSTGDISSMTVAHAAAAGEYTTTGKVAAEGEGFKVSLYITNTEVKNVPGYTAPSAPGAG